MTWDILIRRARLIHADREESADLAIQSGRIAAIGDLSGDSAAEIVDAEHLCLMPGLIDSQVHFREPGLTHKEDIESGSRAALHGGVTTFFEMPNTIPPTTSAAALQDKLNRAQGRSWSHYAFFVGASPDNIGQLAELERLPGTPGIKIFLGSSTGNLLIETDDLLRAVLQDGRYPCPVHSEDEPRNRARKQLFHGVSDPVMHPVMRDAESARLATERLLRIVAETRRPVHVLHVSTADELPLLADAKRRGLPVTCEFLPQHITFSGPDVYERLGAFAQQNPPIRTREHRDAIRAAVRDGLFDVLASDHAPHTRAEKEGPFPATPSGMPGVQTTLFVMLRFVREGLLTLSDLVRLGATNPANLYRLPHKGRLTVGADADLLLLDPDHAFTFTNDLVQSRCGWSPYSGETLYGRLAGVLLNGKWALRDGERIGGPQGQQVSFR